MHKSFWLERYKEKDNLENLGVDTKSVGCGSGWRPVAGFCEHGNEHSGLIFNCCENVSFSRSVILVPCSVNQSVNSNSVNSSRFSSASGSDNTSNRLAVISFENPTRLPLCSRNYIVYVWYDNIKRIFKKQEGGRVDWINLAQEGEKWRALVNTVKDVRFTKCGEFLYWLQKYWLLKCSAKGVSK